MTNDAQSDDPTLAGEAWFLADGTRYTGGVFETADPDSKPFGEVEVDCRSCGGTGRFRFNKRRPCRVCDGERVVFDQARLYTEAELSAKEARQRKAAATRESKRVERETNALVGHQAFVDANPELWARAQASDDKFVQDLIVKSQQWGGLTEKQLEALKSTFQRQDEEKALYATSTHVGTVGDRIEVEVECRGGTSFMAKKFKGSGMEQIFLTELADKDGNCFVTITAAFTMERGERALIRGTVKKHDERKGWPRTQLNRVMLLERKPVLEALPPPEQAPVGAHEEELEYAAPMPGF